MTYEEFKKSALTKKTQVNNISDSYLKFKNNALSGGNTREKTVTPTFKTLEEAQEYAKQNNLKVANTTTKIPTLTTKTTSPMQDKITEIREDHANLKEAELKEMINSYDKGNWGANFTLGDLQIEYNRAMSKYFETQKESDLAKAEEILNKMKLYRKYATNVGKGNWITKDFAEYFPQKIEQIKAGAGGAIVGGATGATAGGAIGSVVPGAGTGAGAITGGIWGAGAGYAGAIARFSYEQMRGNAYADLLELGVPNDIALKVANDTALWQSIVEGAGAVVDILSLGIGKLFSKGAKTTAQLTVKKMIINALKAYGYNVASETVEEGVQEGIAIEGEKKALEQAGIERTTTSKEDWSRIFEAGAGGFKIALISGSGNAIGNITVSTINVSTINSVNKTYDEYIDKVMKNTELTAIQKKELISDAEAGRKNTLQEIEKRINEKGTKNNTDSTKTNQNNMINTIDNAQNVSNFEKTVQTNIGNIPVAQSENRYDIITEKTKNSNNNNKSRFNLDLEKFKSGLYNENDNIVVLEETPEYFYNLGYELDKPIILNMAKLRDIMKEPKGTINGVNQHGITIDLVEQLPNAIKNPLNVIKNPKFKNRYVIVTELTDQYGDIVIVPIEMNTNGMIEGIYTDVNRINSVYGKENYDLSTENNIESYMERNKNNIVYDVDKDVKKRSLTMNINPRLQLPNENISSASVNNIIQSNGNYVNKQKETNNREDSKEQSSNFLPKNIQGLEDYTEQEIKNIVSDYIQDLMPDITIKGIEINGSRMRGDAKISSDLDVVVEYVGDISEDALFNILNEDPLEIEGIKVDINPITASKSGTMDEYIKKSKEYDGTLNEQNEHYDTAPEKQVITDNQGRKLTKEQQEYFKDSKVRDRDGILLTMYHGTKQNFNVFDIKKLGNNMRSAGNYGDGFYFTPNKDSAIWYSGGNGNLKEVYLNIKRPFSYLELYNYNGEEYYNDFIKIAKLVELNLEWRNIPISYGSKQTWENIEIDIKKLLKEGKSDSEIDNIMYEKYGDLPENLNEVIHNYAKNNGAKTLRERLVELGFDGIITSDTPATSSEIVAFYPNQIKSVDNTSPTDSDDILKDIEMDYNADIVKNGFYSQLESTIINKMQRQANSKDVMNLIQKNGVKQDEIAWTGIDDFLASKETVTKEEVLEYIRANHIEIEEVIKDDSSRKEYLKRENEISQRRSELHEEIEELLDFYLVDGNGTAISKLYHHMVKTAWEDEEFTTLVNLEKFEKDGDKYAYNNYEEGARSFTKEEMLEDMRKIGKLYQEWEELNKELETMSDEGWKSDGSDTKFQEYATNWQDEYDNYREILFTLPNAKGAKEFSTVHWGEKNVLAHTRLNDYKDVDGKKVLFIEEIQSDMHQTGRKYGYVANRDEIINKINALKYEALHLRDVLVGKNNREINRINDRQFEIRDEQDKIVSKYYKPSIDEGEVWYAFNEITRILRVKTDPVNYVERKTIDLGLMNDDSVEMLRKSIHLSEADLKKYLSLYNESVEKFNTAEKLQKETQKILENNEKLQRIEEEIENLEEQQHSVYNKIDSKFPFKKNWHEFVLRKIINEAVQQGYDKVAWTTGKQQNDRYNLSKYVDAIEYYENDSGKNYDIYVYQDGAVVRKFESYPVEQLEELVGKEIANKMINGEGESREVKSLFYDTNIREGHILSGIDLEIGGEGMKGFYDKIIPEYLSKYLKKWNSKVEEVSIPSDYGTVNVQQGFTITPEMRESIKKTGQSLYDNNNAQYDTTTNEKISKRKTTNNLKSEKKPKVVYRRFKNDFVDKGYIDLNGKTINSLSDVADIAQIFRNPKYETFRIIYVKGNIIVGQEAISSKIPNSVYISKNMNKEFYKVQNRMSRLGADGYYMVHNHPSGKAVASKADVNTTSNYLKNVDGFKGHVIVDSGTYAVIERSSNGMDRLSVLNSLSIKDYKQDEIDNMMNEPWKGITVNGRDDVAKIMHNVKNSLNYSTLILINAQSEISVLIDLPNNFFNMSQKQIDGYIKNIAKENGATRAILATMDDLIYQKANEMSTLLDTTLYEENGEELILKEGNVTNNEVFENDNKASIRIGEESNEKRAERVRKYIEETQKAIGTLGQEVSRKEIVDRIVNNLGIETKGNSKEINSVSKRIKENIKTGSLTDEKISSYVEELGEELKAGLDDYYLANKELKELIRRTKLYVSENVKKGFAHWNDFRKTNIGTLRVTNDNTALPVDSFYKELTEMYGESFFPSSILNASDQLERIAEIAKEIKVIDKSLKETLYDNYGRDAWNEVSKELVENLKSLRENLSKDTSMKIKAGKTKIRKWTKTVPKNDMVSHFIGDEIKELRYVTKTNSATVQNANETINSIGYKRSIDYFRSKLETGQRVTAEDIAMGERLIQEALKQGDFETAIKLVSDVAILGTELGQSVQALSIISRLTPAGQLMYLERAVQRMNAINKSKKGKEIVITSKMKLEILSAQTQEDLKNAMDSVKQQIADQMEVTVGEKLNDWRYLAMLGNTTTHIRNIVSNTAMKGMYGTKNNIQRIIETIFDSKLEERTRTFEKSTDVVKKFAEQSLKDNEVRINSGGKYNIDDEIKSMRKMFKTKAVEAVRKFNAKALDVEDLWFSRPVYKQALAEYLTANGIKTQKDIDLNPETIQKGINHAILEAQKATFRQANAFASFVSQGRQKGGILKFGIDAILPFAKTPANIAVTSFNYSPAGLVTNIVNDSIKLKNGLIDANGFIEHVSQGLTGTAIFGLGMLLASLGMARGTIGDEEEYAEEVGKVQEYSIRLFGKNYDLSWLSPVAVPFFMGAEVYSLYTKSDSSSNPLNIATETTKAMFNPLSKMSMVSTLNSILTNASSYENDLDGIEGAITTAVSSYIGQYFPTLLRKIAQITDRTVRSTKPSKNSPLKEGERILRQTASKIPVASFLLEPSTDIWGNDVDRGNVLLRGFNSLFNPSSNNTDISTDVDNEIMRLYEINGNNDIIPKIPNDYFTYRSQKYELNAKEYTEFKKMYGQTAYKELEELFASSEYKGMSDEEKENAIKDVYSNAKAKAQYYHIADGDEEKAKLYEYYPASSIYKYKVNSLKTVDVEYTEADMQEYAKIAKETYEKLLSTEEKKRTYKEMSAEEQKKTRESLLTKAKNTAKDTVSAKIYKRSR